MSDKVANPPPWLPIAHRNNRNDEDGEQEGGYFVVNVELFRIELNEKS